MELPKLGEHCSEKTCNRLDFLPFTCDACETIFCRDHISYSSHSCPSAHKKDVQVPVCPLCDAPIPMKRGDPPDLAVGLHIDNDCQADPGKQRIFTNKCSSKGCKIKELVRVDCKECGMNFCLKHRHPNDHNCIGREEAVRLRRLQALAKKSQPVSKPVVTDRNSRVFQNIQGSMSEDEALARALQVSMQDQEKHLRPPADAEAPEDRNRCSLS